MDLDEALRLVGCFKNREDLENYINYLIEELSSVKYFCFYYPNSKFNRALKRYEHKVLKIQLIACKAIEYEMNYWEYIFDNLKESSQVCA